MPAPVSTTASPGAPPGVLLDAGGEPHEELQRGVFAPTHPPSSLLLLLLWLHIPAALCRHLRISCSPLPLSKPQTQLAVAYLDSVKVCLPFPTTLSSLNSFSFAAQYSRLRRWPSKISSPESSRAAADVPRSLLASTEPTTAASSKPLLGLLLKALSTRCFSQRSKEDPQWRRDINALLRDLTRSTLLLQQCPEAHVTMPL